MKDQRPFPKSDIRIGHRGLEHRQFDDTYWLNGTNIDRDVYSLELQRIIAHTNEQKKAQEVRQRQAELLQKAFDEAHRIQTFYGYAPYYPGALYAPSNTAESDQSGARARADSAKAAQEANAALARKERKRAKEPPQFSLKNSPLFGEAVFGPFYNWTFDSPFTRLHMWLVRWAWQHLRHARAS